MSSNSSMEDKSSTIEQSKDNIDLLLIGLLVMLCVSVGLCFCWYIWRFFLQKEVQVWWNKYQVNKKKKKRGGASGGGKSSEDKMKETGYRMIGDNDKDILVDNEEEPEATDNKAHLQNK